MTEAIDTRPTTALHPVQAVLLASTFPLLLGALLNDWAYSSTYEIQWTNFASWLVAGGLVFVGLALVWALIDLFRSDVRRNRSSWLHFGLLLATFVVGFLNLLVHAKDAWAAMPEGFILSAMTVLLSLAAIWTGFSTWREGR